MQGCSVSGPRAQALVAPAERFRRLLITRPFDGDDVRRHACPHHFFAHALVGWRFDALLISTATNSEAVEPFPGGGGQPNFVDINGIVSKFQFNGGSPSIVRADLVGLTGMVTPSHIVNFVDVNTGIDAFSNGDSNRPDPDPAVLCP